MPLDLTRNLVKNFSQDYCSYTIIRTFKWSKFFQLHCNIFSEVVPKPFSKELQFYMKNLRCPAPTKDPKQRAFN